MSAYILVWVALAIVGLWGIAVIAGAHKGSDRFAKDIGQGEERDWLTDFTWASHDEETVTAVLAHFVKHAPTALGAKRVVALYAGREAHSLSFSSAWSIEMNPYFVASDRITYHDSLDSSASKMRVTQDIRSVFIDVGVDVIMTVTRNDELLAAVGIDFGDQEPALERKGDLELAHLVLSRASANIMLHTKALNLHSFVKSEAEARELSLGMVPTERSGEQGAFRWRGHFAHAYDPSSEFWGVYPLEHERVLVIMGEAKKETLAGAMIAAVVKSCSDQILKELPIAPGPKALLEMLNLSLFRANGEARSSCVAIILDPSRNSLTYACAGHPSPYRVRRDSKRMDVTALDRQGPLLGETASPAYEQHEVSLETADSLVVVSSGLLSPQDRNAEAFGAQRLVEHLSKQVTADVEWLMEEILSAITLHSFDESLREGQALLVVGAL